jgi:hypothetical protein
MMLNIIRSNRTHALTAILLAAAFVICGIAWTRFFTMAATNPSPVRYVEFETEAGTLAPFQQTCAGPAFIEGDTVWRFCAYTAGRFSTEWGLVRFDLALGKAALRWPLPETAGAQILALAEAPSGDLAVAFGAPDLSAIYLIMRGGGSVWLGVPPAIPARVGGLVWVGERLELAGDDQISSVTVNTNESGAWDASRTIPRPAVCDSETLCALQAAQRTAEGWRLVYALAPVQIGDPQTTFVDFVIQDESGTLTLLDPVALAELDPSQYAINDRGRLMRLGELFDRSPGNAVNWLLVAAPFVLSDESWTRITPPGADASFYFSNYQIESGGLRWIPGLRYPQNVWHVNDWVMLKRADDGIHLAQMGGGSGPALTTSATLLSGGAQTIVLPASDGGYWVLGPHGAYIKADQSLQRTDHLNLLERTTRTFENFGRLRSVSGEFYREKRAIKMAALPMVLLALPVGYLLVFFVRQTRKNTRAWILLLLQMSAIYLILALIFFWWFWQVMDDF